MAFIDEKGKLFGAINIVDTAIVILVIAVITTVYIYTFSPPHIYETEEVIFQTYFVSRQYTQPINKGVAYQIFVEGNEFAATTEGTQAVITDVQFIRFRDSDEEVNVLLTLNGTFRLGIGGQYLFNGLEIAPGKEITPQIAGSYMRGTIHRVNYNHQKERRNVSVFFTSDNLKLLEKNTHVIDYNGHVVGTIISIDKDFSRLDGIAGYLAEIDLLVDVYDDIFYFEERPLYYKNYLDIATVDGMFEGYVVEVS